MPTAVIDTCGTIRFLTKPNNTPLLKLSDYKLIFRASNIEVFSELDQDTQEYLNKKYCMDIYSLDDDDLYTTFEPYDFWVQFGYQDLLGPFNTREEAVNAEEQELRRRGDA